jgi:hypothetical protein
MPRPPKDPAIRQRRNKAPTAAVLPVESPAGKPAKAPALGRHPSGRAWHPRTRAWWEDGWRSVVAQKYLTIDRHRLLLAAVLIDDFWKAKDASARREAHQEIRLALSAFGQTPLDRWRLQWSIHETPAELPTPAPAPAPPSSTPQPPIAVGEDPRRVLSMVPKKS